MSDLMIEAQDLVRTFESGRVRALDGVSLQVQTGEFVAVTGPSGCGKSTLLNVLAGIDQPNSGVLRVAGEYLAELRGAQLDTYRQRTIGLVFQLHNLLPNLTAHENVQVPLIAAGLSRQERGARASELLERVGLEHRSGARPTTMSGGERQRVAIARALVNQPELLLADEPTGALDSKNGAQLFDLLADLRETLNMTLVVVTHEVDVAQRAQRVIEMLDGQVVRSQ